MPAVEGRTVAAGWERHDCRRNSATAKLLWVNSINLADNRYLTCNTYSLDRLVQTLQLINLCPLLDHDMQCTKTSVRSSLLQAFIVLVKF